MGACKTPIPTFVLFVIIYEKSPDLDEKHIQVNMDLACDPDETTFAISSLIHGPDLL